MTSIAPSGLAAREHPAAEPGPARGRLSLRLRLATPADHDRLCAIWDAASAAGYPFLSNEERSAERVLIRDRFLPSALTWVAESDGVAVGFLSLLAHEIAGLFVLPSHQRRGIGGLLVARAIDPAQESVVHVYTANAAALDFYRGMGFQPMGWKDVDGLGRPHPMVLMVRPASAASADIDAGARRSPSAEVETVRIDALPAFVGLFDAYRQFYGQPSDPAAASGYLMRRLARGESVILGARIDGRPVGFAQLYPTWSSIRMAPTLVLNDLYVDPSARSHGVGLALVRACEAEGRRRGVPSISLETQRSNHAAIALYERMGWRQDTEFLTFTRSLT